MRFRRTINSLKNLDARQRLLLSIVAAGIVFSLLPSSMLLPTRILVTWDFGILLLLTLIGVLVSFTTPQQMRDRVQNQDETPSAILAFVISAASASFFAIIFILSNAKGLPPVIASLHVGLSIIAIICSWLLTHTVFALHYAHNYYSKDDDSESPSSEAGGLDFPDEDLPDYWDFLYFSLVIGMTSQVSDVAISSRSLRRIALVHGVLSFIFNTAILALSMNIIGGLLGN
jgi:uncharacterized membrane protein